MAIEPTLLARAKAFARKSPALTILPLASVCLPAASARAVSASPPTLLTSSPAFNPGFSSGSGGSVTLRSGSTTGSQQLPQGSDGIIGVKDYGIGTYDVTPSVSIGTTTLFSATGGGLGTLPSNTMIPLSYSFNLGGSGLASVAWTLSFDLQTGTSTAPVDHTMDFSGAGLGDFTLAAPQFLSIPGGGSIAGYKITFSGSFFSNSGGTLAITIPQNSFDFNAVPEPSTWTMMGAGLAALGVAVARRRAATVNEG